MEATESQEQAALFQWIRLQPEIKHIAFSTANGAQLAGSAKKRAMQMNNLKATGFLVGTPDIVIPVARKPYSAMFIELKRKKGGNVSENQKNVLKALSDAGNCCVVAYGCDDAIKHIKEYLSE